MKNEKIYSIPVNEAFEKDCECPVCAMYDSLERDALEYTMGPSYMEDDIRAMTDEQGFCRKHSRMLSSMGNKLGMALMMKTHFDRVINEVRNAQKTPAANKKSIFKKENTDNDKVAGYIDKLSCSCFVCSRVDATFERYLDTIFYLWKNEAEFRENFRSSKGFCTLHYGQLRRKAADKLDKSALEEFLKQLDELYIVNMERVRDDLAWFINKFDYKYADEPWNNAKDSIPRAMTKISSILPEEEA